MMEMIKNILVTGLFISLALKLILHYYLDMTFFGNYMEAIKFSNSYKRILCFYKRQEAGTRNILKRILNVSFWIFLTFFLLTVIFEPFYIFY